ncbi:MAG TPA: hypothetical protein VHC19_23765 [Pirellulales bacterium]|nr:hypothetical protein [Pirellulales bacterium]
MRSSWHEGWLALAVVLALGCGRQAEPLSPSRAVTARATSAVDPTGASLQATRADVESSPRSVEAQDLSSQVMLALDDRTVMGQPLPAEPKEHWNKAVRALAKENPFLIRLMTDRAEAKWLLQVAALERTDIIYLTPAPTDGSLPGDESLRMSPPGEAAIEWLKAELEEIARDGIRSNADAPPPSELDLLTDQLTGLLDENSFESEGKPLPETGSPPEPEVDADPRAAEMNRARRDMERARQRYEQQRAQAAGAMAGSLLFHHGPVEDLKAQIVEEQDGTYHTANRTQAVLGTYGKMVDGNRLLHRLARFEHRGVVRRLDRVRRFVTVDRTGRGSGNDFVTLVGNRQAWQIVDLAAQLSAGRHQEVAFEILGVRLDQNDVIRALNADSDALGYFEYLRDNDETPCLVLETIIFTSYAAASEGNLALGINAKTILTSDGVGARTENRRNSFTKFAAPVIRCYQPYEVKMNARQVVELSYLDP